MCSVQNLCAESRGDRIIHLSWVWLIPKEAEKPVDSRKKENKNRPL